jgi:LPXTG-motif cell wall-anchored protein
MSRPTFRHRAGLILTLVAFMLGATAATALGWENETNKGRDHGKNEGKDHGKKNEKPPTVTVPKPTKQPPPPPPTPPGLAPPPAAAAPAPVVPLATPTPTTPNVKAKGGPGGGKGGGKGGVNTPAEVAPATSSPALAPAVEREQLAETGLNPALMALLGALCLGGGALLFRRALTR